MRKLILIATCFALTGVAPADIQSPPGSWHTPTRKLGRAISNILYGIIEIPEQIARKSEAYGGKQGYSYGLVDGQHRALKRFGYGWYELFTFYCPTYHGTFKPPYQRCGTDWRIEMNPHDGLSEFPPELGAECYHRYSRSQRY
ncbi:MAG: exosortase system-associated protein, TIGR04073 family [Akkermansiaceae bacterium]|nr:exosortase system-associated protein, TIGR04073 family [Akkermansiaceae bacterium]NNM30393.1 exosortase system-associated protein, TIGR04073 family [Akkermansiaceae bacterium]